MTDHDLHTLVRDHVASDEPPFLLSPDESITRGRRRLRRRRALTGGVCAATLAAIAAVAVPAYVGSGDGGDTQVADNLVTDAWADYDAGEMPRIIDERTRAVLTRTAPDLPVGVRAVTDSQGTPLPQKHWDKASQMTVDYTLPGHEYRVSLLHARSEAEGDRSEFCTDQVGSGWMLSCELVDEEGSTVSTVVALRRTSDGAWAVVPRAELATIDPDRLWFEQQVESVRSETLVVNVSEVVKAPSQEDAAVRWHAPLNDLIEIATDPELAIPAPPTGEDGCVWSLPVTDSTTGGDLPGCAAQAVPAAP